MFIDYIDYLNFLYISKILIYTYIFVFKAEYPCLKRFKKMVIPHYQVSLFKYNPVKFLKSSFKSILMYTLILSFNTIFNIKIIILLHNFNIKFIIMYDYIIILKFNLLLNQVISNVSSYLTF